MAVIRSFYSFFSRDFNCLGYSFSFMDIVIFGALCWIVGYFISAFFKK